MNSDVLNTILTAVVVPLLVALTGYLVAFINTKINELKGKMQAQELVKYVGVAEDAITASVNLVSQTIVDYLKANGGWNEEAAKNAFAVAKARALQIMGTAAVEVLQMAYGDVDAWLNAKIEEAVRAGKVPDIETVPTVTPPPTDPTPVPAQ